MTPIVRLAETAADREAAFALRYRVYVEHMGKPYPEADHERKRLSDSFDEHAMVLVVSQCDEIVATARLIPATALLTSPAVARWPDGCGVSRTAVSWTSRLVVDNRWRRTGVFQALVNALYCAGRDGLDSRLDLIHTRRALVPLFEHIGYRRYGEPFFDAASGLTQCPMALVMHDLEHFRRVRSPLVELAETRPLDHATVKALREYFEPTGNRSTPPEAARRPDRWAATEARPE